MSRIIELPNAASFLLAETCNMSCKYCFVNLRSPKFMSKEVAKRSIEFLVENAKKSGLDHISAMLFGGEPLLNLPVMEFILDYGSEYCKKNELMFSANLVTNATIMNDEVKRIINKAINNNIGFQVQLSIDGIKESHDAYRVDTEGKGTFDRIEKNIVDWKELFKNRLDSLSIHGCLNKNSLKHLYESYMYFRETWGVEFLWFMPIHSETWEDIDVDVYEEQLTKIYDYVMDKTRKNKNIDEINFYAPLNRAFNRTGCFPLPCGAGNSFVTITAEGKISPCHQFYFNDPEEYTLIGDIWKGIDEQKRKLFTSYEPDDLSCKLEDPDCDYYSCYRCIADNYHSYGSILSVVRGIRCKMSKVEQKLINKIREELKTMSLLNNDNNNDTDACKCNLGGSGDPCKCNLGGSGEGDRTGSCFCVSEGGSHTPNIGSSKEEYRDSNSDKSCCNNESTEVIAEALKTIIKETRYNSTLLEALLRKLS